MRRYLAFLALAVLSCSPASTLEPVRSASLGEVFPLRVGQVGRLEGEALFLSFDQVLEDSRCARYVVCIWEGNARLRLGLGTSAPAEQTAELNTGVDPKTHTTNGYLIELVRLEPSPPPQAPVAQEAYVARFRVTRLP